MTQAFPLQWPQGRSRTASRKPSNFSVKPSQAYDEMIAELDRFGARSVVVSTNVPLRRDGTPYRDGLDDRLQDPGVAVYFQRGKRLICLPCDTYQLPWENCRAVGKAVEAMRSMERHGASQILDQAFEGFMALPAPGAVGPAPDKAWWVILNVDPGSTPEQINDAWKRLCREGGKATVELNAAKDAGLLARGQK